MIELERELPARTPTTPPDAPGEIADAVTALRLATAAPVAAGPVVFERLDWHPFGDPAGARRSPRPSRAGEPTRLDPFRGRPRRRPARAARAGRGRPRARRGARPLGAVAVRGRAVRSEQLRESLAALLGGGDGLWAAAMRAAVLVGETRPRAGRALRPPARAHARRAGRSRGADVVRRAIVEVLLHERPRRGCSSALDDALLGLRPRPRRLLRACSRRELTRTKPARSGVTCRGYRRSMDEARRVLARLERIEALERERCACRRPARRAARAARTRPRRGCAPSADDRRRRALKPSNASQAKCSGIRAGLC